MDTKGYRNWFIDRLYSTQLLLENCGEVATSDAEILLCCAIGALAAFRWPGKGIDRFRFVQFLTDLTDPSFKITLISTPVLAARLRLAGNVNEAFQLKEAFFPGSDYRLLTGLEVDRSENDILYILPHIERKLVRSQSYASLIYTDLRSKLVHEYSLSTLLSSITHQENASLPEYTNMQLDLNPRQIDDLVSELGASEEVIRSWCSAPIRQLHLPFIYLRDAMVSAAEQAFLEWDRLPDREIPRPPTWWIEVTN